MNTQMQKTRDAEKEIRDFISRCQLTESQESQELIQLIDKWNNLHHIINEENLLVCEGIHELGNNHFEILTNLLVLSDDQINLED